ncbi:hypothetical protein [Amycolatopsis minnesotensis]|uniref:Uncharacterized protein n=1 Tax=Amycolatopsis minnesotensis TaxID=337894 RepID=A0ABN2S9V1_9PSEU
MTSTDTAGAAAVVTLPDADYVVGGGHGAQHAVEFGRAARTLRGEGRWGYLTSAVCEAVVLPVAKWGPWTYDNPRFTGVVGQPRCPACGWLVALAQDTAAAELALLRPTAADLAVLSRLLPAEPLPAHRICAAILADPAYDPDHPHLAQLLGHVTAHTPRVLLPEDCADGGCDHDRADDEAGHCSYPDASLGCAVCSVRAGSWAGEYEGQFASECTVPAPCEVLRTAAAHYDVAIGG